MYPALPSPSHAPIARENAPNPGCVAPVAGAVAVEV